MEIKIIEQELEITLYGISGHVVNQNYGETGMKLMDTMWNIVKSNHLKHKGINHWVYNEDMTMMAGVELEEIPDEALGLERKQIHLSKYAYWKHIGPYTKLFNVNAEMRKELTARHIVYHHPCIEIYGHWSEDENKLETEILWAID